MTGYFTVPKLWPRSTVAILAGGPSLTQAQVDACRDRCRVIAVNNAYQCAPWADVLYFCDEKWWGWHRDRAGYRDFAGMKMALETAGKVFDAEPAVKKLRYAGRGQGQGPQNQAEGPKGLCLDRDGLCTGSNSGYQAINLAVHLGAHRIVLLGFDMKSAASGRMHWHDEHPMATDPNVWANEMLPCFPHLVEPLRRLGVDVINATPGSALKVFAMQPLEVALGLREAA